MHAGLADGHPALDTEQQHVVRALTTMIAFGVCVLLVLLSIYHAWPPASRHASSSSKQHHGQGLKGGWAARSPTAEMAEPACSRAGSCTNGLRSAHAEPELERMLVQLPHEDQQAMLRWQQRDVAQLQDTHSLKASCIAHSCMTKKRMMVIHHDDNN